MNESDIIRLFHEPGTDAGLDDCAVLPGAAGDVLVTTDSMSEGVHFRMDWSGPVDLARKLVEVNVSDLCASGGRPEWALLNLGLPKDVSDEFIRAFAVEIRAACSEHAVRLIGGDTFRAAEVQLTFTLGGPASRRLGRDGGRPGDNLYLTGQIGLALVGLRLLGGTVPAEHGDSLADRARERHLRPRARRAWAERLAEEAAVHATMDLSDGLYLDAPRLAAASHLSLEIDLDAVPVAEGLRERGWLAPGEEILSGEEFELLFLGSPHLEFDFPCRAIGRAIDRPSRSAKEAESAPGVRYTYRGKPFDPARIAGAEFRHFD